MALEIKYSYKKDGEVIKFKTPRMKVIGKDMDDDETWTFIILYDKIRVNEREWNDKIIKSYSMFVTVPDDKKRELNLIDDFVMNLDLSQQAYKYFQRLELHKGMRVQISKFWYEDSKTGAKRPGVNVKAVHNNTIETSVQPSTYNDNKIDPYQVFKDIKNVIPVMMEPENKDIVRNFVNNKYKWFWESFKSLYLEEDSDEELDKIYKEFFSRWYDDELVTPV